MWRNLPCVASGGAVRRGGNEVTDARNASLPTVGQRCRAVSGDEADFDFVGDEGGGGEIEEREEQGNGDCGASAWKVPAGNVGASAMRTVVHG